MFENAQKEYHTQNKSAEKEKSIHSKTNIPMQMKRHFEDLSGFSFDDVRVNYNSGKPAQLNALAYTQGNNIYIAPGMEKTLPHELGHVVQQKQGRVKPNVQGTLINNDISLENEADAMYNRNQVYKMPYNYNGSVVQLYKTPETYQANGTTCLMQCEGSDTPFNGLPVEGPKNELAILYEIIVYDKDAKNVIQNFRDKFNSEPCRNDVALSLVVNHKVGDKNLKGTLTPVERTNNPLINVERVIWGMKSEKEGDSAESHKAREEIPYYSLRRRAAINPGAKRLDAILRINSDNVWRRMCDSDVSFRDPRSDNQIDALKRLADDYCLKMVTFGYILQTPSEDYNEAFKKVSWLEKIPIEKQEDIKDKVKEKVNKFIDMIYQYEAELREVLYSSSLDRVSGEHRIDYYPCEPSTYYKFEDWEVKSKAESKYWKEYSEKQIAEGRTFKGNFIKGKKHDFVSEADTLERTGAGKRHEEFIQVFLHDDNIEFDEDNKQKQIKFVIQQTSLFEQIRKLKQSYFNPKTHHFREEQIPDFENAVDKFLEYKKLYKELQKDEYIVKWE